MNSGLFEGWFEHVFIPLLKNPKASILILDNASHHSKERLYEIADDYGVGIIFLPKYSPDLNPIEKYWANIKNWLRLHMRKRKFDEFWDGFSHAFGCR